MKAIRERERLILGTEVERRLRLPVDQWAPIGALDEVTRNARAYLQKPSESKDKVSRGIHNPNSDGVLRS
ncbi:MAG: hypothetical protein OXQ29_14440 [Rhodospirillaceae bacterium]|nr:hypothetical protein [Rhodospirillaceae bacterium]